MDPVKWLEYRWEERWHPHSVHLQPMFMLKNPESTAAMTRLDFRSQPTEAELYAWTECGQTPLPQPLDVTGE